MILKPVILRPFVLLTAVALFVGLGVVGCSSTGSGPDNIAIDDTTTSSPDATPGDTPSTTRAPVVTEGTVTAPPNQEPIQATISEDIPELPPYPPPAEAALDPDLAPEDALYNYFWLMGREVIIGCDGLPSDAFCAQTPPRISDEPNGRQLMRYAVGPPPPAVAWYSVYVEGSVEEGWWIYSAAAIAR